MRSGHLKQLCVLLGAPLYPNPPYNYPNPALYPTLTPSLSSLLLIGAPFSFSAKMTSLDILDMSFKVLVCSINQYLVIYRGYLVITLINQKLIDALGN